jgi:hypothetical protein
MRPECQHIVTIPVEDLFREAFAPVLDDLLEGSNTPKGARCVSQCLGGLDGYGVFQRPESRYSTTR